MKKYIDLHIHSNFSEDADLPVEEIFILAQKLKISAISITDHDSIKSINNANSISNKYPVEYIPAVEITTILPQDGSQQHIIGYFVDENNSNLIEVLKKITGYRLLIAKKRIEALKNIGFFLNEEKIWKTSENRALTATSIMLEIFNNEKNLNNLQLHDFLYGNKKENKMSFFYKEFFMEGKLAYVPFQSISAKEAIEIIIKAGGIPVLAHPKFVKKREWLEIIKKYGIQGIEAISTYHNKEDVIFFIEFAKKNNLLITAGSDFHGPTSKPNVKIGGIEGNDYIYFEKLKDFHQNSKNIS